MKFFSIVLLITLTLLCVLPKKIEAGSTPEAYSDALIVLSDATRVKYSKSGGTDQVSYVLKREYPATDVIEFISHHLNEKGWSALRENWLNPGLANSQVRGWTNFADATTNPHSTVFQWSSDWQNSRGDIVSYFFQYRDPGESLLPRRPKTTELTVSASYFPEPVAKEMKKWAADNRDKWKSSDLDLEAVGLDDEDRDIVLWGIRSENGPSLEYRITSKSAKLIPEWLPDRQHPPLTISKALEIARKYALKSHSKIDDVAMWHLEIMPVGSPSGKNRWFYVFTLVPVIDKQTMYGGNFYVVVLMDGTVVEPEEKP